jgi:T5SS/PEP-CTERM-associated repeat protein
MYFHWIQRRVLFVLIAFTCLLAGRAMAQANSWTNANAGKWEIGSNWSLGVPTNTHSCFITNAFSKTVTVDAATVSSNAINSCMTVNNLTVSGPLSPFSANTLSLNSAGLATNLHVQNSLTIGDRGAVGIFNSVLRVSGVVSNDGIMSLNTGLILATNAALIVGNARVGQLTVFDGTVRANSLIVGRLAGSQGTLTISGGTNNCSINVGLEANATGTVWVTGGQLVASNGFIQIGSAGVGQMTVSNGTVTADGIGLASFPGSAGTLTMAGGTLTTRSLLATNVGAQVAFPGGTTTLGHPTVGIGANVATGQLMPIGTAGRMAVLNLVSSLHRFEYGFSVAAEAGSTGTVSVTGAQLLTTNDLFGLRVGNSGVGTMTLSNSGWRAARIIVGYNPLSEGTLTIAGTSSVEATSLTLGLDFNSTGTVFLTGAGSQLITTNGLTTIGDHGVARMTVSNGTWRAREAIVGYNLGGDGVLTFAGGTNIFSSFLGMGNANATGTVVVTGGQLIATNFGISVGAGAGRLIVSNGNVRTWGVGLPEAGGGRGELVVAGGNADLGFIAASGGFTSTGLVWVTGGQLTVTNGGIGLGEPFGKAEMTVSNGNVLATAVLLGLLNGPNNSLGTLIIAGGTNTVTSSLAVGFDATCTGVVSMSGGTLITTNATTTVGSNGVGQVPGGAATCSSAATLVREVR